MEEDEGADDDGDEGVEDYVDTEEDDDERERRKYSIVFSALNDIIYPRDTLSTYQHLEIKSDMGEMSQSDTATDPQMQALSEGCLNINRCVYKYYIFMTRKL